jgi:hypothetical protein
MVPAIRRIRPGRRRGRTNDEFGGHLNVLDPGDPADSDTQQRETGPLAAVGSLEVAVSMLIGDERML